MMIGEIKATLIVTLGVVVVWLSIAHWLSLSHDSELSRTYSAECISGGPRGLCAICNISQTLHRLTFTSYHVTPSHPVHLLTYNHSFPLTCPEILQLFNLQSQALAFEDLPPISKLLALGDGRLLQDTYSSIVLTPKAQLFSIIFTDAPSLTSSATVALPNPQAHKSLLKYLLMLSGVGFLLCMPLLVLGLLDVESLYLKLWVSILGGLVGMSTFGTASELDFCGIGFSLVSWLFYLRIFLEKTNFPTDLGLLGLVLALCVEKQLNQLALMAHLAICMAYLYRSYLTSLNSLHILALLVVVYCQYLLRAGLIYESHNFQAILAVTIFVIVPFATQIISQMGTNQSWLAQQEEEQGLQQPNQRSQPIQTHQIGI